MLTLLDFGSFLKISKIVDKSSAHTVEVFSMQPNPHKCHMRQKTKNIINFTSKIKNPLELRLAMVPLVKPSRLSIERGKVGPASLESFYTLLEALVLGSQFFALSGIQLD